MKTHLPKELRLALMAALMTVSFMPVWAEAEVVQPEEATSEYEVELALADRDYVTVDGKNVLNVGAGKVTGYGLYYNAALTTDKSMIVGNKTDEQGNVIIPGNCDMIGLVKDGGFVSYGDLNDGKSQTKNFKVGSWGDKDLTIYGSGQVVLGGQLKSDKKYDFYQGIIANKITVEGDGSVTNLEVSNAELNELEVKSGKAVLHDGGNFRNGNDYHLENNALLYKGTTDKQVLIRKKITVSGGELQLGSDSELEKVTKQYLTAFGCNGSTATMIQSGDSTIGVYGYSIAQAGLNIVQAEGEMLFRDRLDFTGSDTNTIWQGYEYDEAGKLKPVADTATENPIASTITFGDLGNGTFELNQANEGTLQIDNVATGSTFTINQSGKGSIVLGAGFDNATVTVSKSTGTLEFNSDVKLGSLTKDGGTIKVAENSTLTADSLNWNLEEKQTKDTGSDIEISGGVSLSGVKLSDGSLSSEGDTVTNTGTLKAGHIVVNNGVFVNRGVIDALEKPQDAASIMLADSGVDETDSLITISKGGELVNEGSIVKDVQVNEGGTLTMVSGSEAANVTVDSGTINVTGSTQIGSLTLNGKSVLNFDFTQTETPAMVELSSDLTLSGDTTIMVTVSSEMLENLDNQEFLFFSDNVNNLTQANIIFTDNDDETQDKVVSVTSGSTSGSIKVDSTVSIPEPTTATLSLLALAGLAMRRRRK